MKPQNLIIFSALLFGAVISANAAEFCVGTVSELRSALSTAESNNEDDDIRIEVGTYATGGSSFYYSESQGFDLTISGGWIDFFGNDCGIQTPNQPFDTILDGSNSSQLLFIRLVNNASFEVSGLTFMNGSTDQRGGGLRVSKEDNLNTGEIVVANNVFINNEATFSGAFSVSGAATFYVRNNLILSNNAISRHAVSVISNDATGVYFNNNTVLANTADDSNEPGGVYLSASGSSQVLVANNVINGNQLEDIEVYYNPAESNYYLYHNNIDVLVGSVPNVASGNFNLPNRFESGLLNYVPEVDSPLVDGGRAPCPFICPFPTPFVNNWELGNIDLLIQARVQGDAVDIGAFESGHLQDLIFWDRFE